MTTISMVAYLNVTRNEELFELLLQWLEAFPLCNRCNGKRVGHFILTSNFNL